MSMLLPRNSSGSPEFELNMTPMIDVIFQLVLFFVFSMEFLAFEGQLNAYLPKDRGLDPPPGPPIIIQQITLALVWDPQDGGSVTCRAAPYVPPDGGAPQDSYLFPMDPGVRPPAMAPDGTLRRRTETTMLTPDGKKGGKVEYDYAAPDFKVIEEYLRWRKAYYDKEDPMGTGIRLTVNFSSLVPWQMIVNCVDICTRVGITDFGINAAEVE